MSNASELPDPELPECLPPEPTPALLAERLAALAEITALEVETAQLQARKARARHRVAELWEAAAAGPVDALLELTGTARIGQNRAGTQLMDSTRLATVFTATLALMDAGELYGPTADVIVAGTRFSSDPVAAEVERRLLAEGAAAWNSIEVRRRLPALLLEVEAELEPEATADRQQAALDRRAVWISPDEDGMCRLGATMDILKGRQWSLEFDELVRAAKIADKRAGVKRTLNQIRSDVLAELPAMVRSLLQAIASGRLEELRDLINADPTAADSLQDLAENHSDLLREVQRQTDHEADPGEPESKPEPEHEHEHEGEREPNEPGPNYSEPSNAQPTDAELQDAEPQAPDSADQAPDSTTGPEPAGPEPDGPEPTGPESAGLIPTGPGWDCWGRPITEPPPPLPKPTPAPAPAEPTSDPSPTSGLPWWQLAVHLMGWKVRTPPVLNIHVPMSTVLDLDHRAGHVEGLGPVSAKRVRILLPTANLRRVQVDRTSGIPLHHDREILPGLPPVDPHDPFQVHRAAAITRERLLTFLTPSTVVDRAEAQHDPSTALRRMTNLRDQRCTGIGCSQPASRCDLDHERRYPDGPTALWNLSAKSKRCHHAKHHGWQVHRDETTGLSTWTSPIGRRYQRQSDWFPGTPLPDDLVLPPPTLHLDQPWPYVDDSSWNHPLSHSLPLPTPPPPAPAPKEPAPRWDEEPLF